MRALLAHQQWLGSDGHAGQQLVGRELNFSDLKLDGLDLSRANIPGSRFVLSTICHVRFVETNLEGSRFLWSPAHAADFRGANLRGAWFTKAPPPPGSLRHARFEEVLWVLDDIATLDDPRSPASEEYRRDCAPGVEPLAIHTWFAYYGTPQVESAAMTDVSPDRVPGPL